MRDTNGNSSHKFLPLRINGHEAGAKKVRNVKFENDSGSLYLIWIKRANTFVVEYVNIARSCLQPYITITWLYWSIQLFSLSPKCYIG